MGLAIQQASLKWYFLFVIGGIAMRSFGCVVNDIFDRDFDKYVERTRDRPLASGALSVKETLSVAAVMLIVGFIVFLQLPSFSKIMSLAALILAVVYPLMKRITYWPQAVLGLAFNFGALITCFDQSKFPIHVVLFVSCFFWTLAYDSIYGFQDISDDIKIGVKSTSQVFAKRPKTIIGILYGICFLGFVSVGILLNQGMFFYAIQMILLSTMCYIVHQWDVNDSLSCRKAFIRNQYVGILMALSLWF